MNGPKPEWYDKLKSGPFTRKTFTMDDIYRIEQKTAESAPGGRVRKLTIPKRRRTLPVLAAVFLCVAAAAFLFRGELEPAVTKAWSGFVKPTEPPQATVPPLQQETGTFYLKGDAAVVSEPKAFGDEETETTVNSENAVTVLEKRNGFVKIGEKRWIPEWYLNKDAEKRLKEVRLSQFLRERPVVTMTAPYYGVIMQDVNFSLYPGEPKPSGGVLKYGRVVEVIRDYRDWVCVNVFSYDGRKYVGDKWVPKENVGVYDSSVAQEGLLKERVEALSPSGTPAYLHPGARIVIEGEADGFYRIRSQSTYTAKINKSDFLPNPFLGLERKEDTDPQWYFTQEEMLNRYEDFTKTRTDDRLKGLEPIDIFRYYVMASEKGDWETVYALLIKGSDYATPGREEYLSDIGREPDADKQAKQKWDVLRKDYTLYQEISGDSAYIVMTKRGSGSPSPEDKQAFSLTRNKAGIWKVSWLPMQ
ncbi:hypothetical protein PC41400_26440 [Paenibacillus chitinolyticus]|uniref:Uncharacterized protein n=1 Tax=Paenibacillus chitinolyticus TaxID=79263 RepID=A0A410X317_9BACL|nr:hypothetical protein [Paenibacillus chitinolyticus]MCY9588920.1 hypothetical protein [Paenibacillus chitinolyticus]MCY9597773.1 hypothetical protein [Paenibacillus chitinolyticus]QAV21018.1 hypothetical protein PC41400_26440 [Paenibacillus chitinolyticus]